MSVSPTSLCWARVRSRGCLCRRARALSSRSLRSVTCGGDSGLPSSRCCTFAFAVILSSCLCHALYASYAIKMTACMHNFTGFLQALYSRADEFVMTRGHVAVGFAPWFNIPPVYESNSTVTSKLHTTYRSDTNVEGHGIVRTKDI